LARRPSSHVQLFPEHSAAERRADAVIHALGLTLGLVACVILSVTALPRAGIATLLSLALYAVGLMAMLTCSALYNLSPPSARKSLFRRLDHAAIFLMIAGTYTPFTLVVIGGAWGIGLCVAVWAVALVGIAHELSGLPRSDGLQTGAYLISGWIIVVALEPLAAAISLPGLVLLVAGGVLYSVGVIFHVWTRLPYQNAIWHAFVLAAATCHYVAILHEVATA
jgi:hemolysin III